MFEKDTDPFLLMAESRPSYQGKSPRRTHSLADPWSREMYGPPQYARAIAFACFYHSGVHLCESVGRRSVEHTLIIAVTAEKRTHHFFPILHRRVAKLNRGYLLSIDCR